MKNHEHREHQGNPNKAVPFEHLSTVGGRTVSTPTRSGGGCLRFFRNLFVSAALLVIGFTACFAAMKLGYLPSFEVPVLTEEHTTITVKELEAIIEPASDLISSRYRYTDADIIDSSKQLMGFNIPLTRDMVVFTYDGVVGVGFDINDVQFTVDEGSEDEKGAIKVLLPKLKVIQNEIDMDSFKYAYEEHSIFNPKNMNYTTEMLGTLKKKAKKRALKDEDFMNDAQLNAETTIKNFLEAAHVGDYYTISIENMTEDEK